MRTSGPVLKALADLDRATLPATEPEIPFAELLEPEPPPAAVPVLPPPPMPPRAETHAERFVRLKKEAEAEKERLKKEVNAKNEQARRLVAKYDYAAAVAVLDSFTPEQRPGRDETLLQSATAKRDRRVVLEGLIEPLLADGLYQHPRLPALLAEFVSLYPTHAEYAPLAKQLTLDVPPAKPNAGDVYHAPRLDRRPRTRAWQPFSAPLEGRGEAHEAQRLTPSRVDVRPWYRGRPRPLLRQERAGRPRSQGRTSTSSRIAPEKTMSTATAPIQTGTEIDMPFAWIPPGRFLMGSDKADDEKPVHRVTISKGFWMGVYPVTQDQFEAVMGYNPSHFRGPTHPVENVSWDDAQEFCKEFGKLTGRPIRLPNEAEWEYACRATTTSDYWSGNDEAALKRFGWYGGDKGPSKGQTQPVGKLEKNKWGLCDVHGNVWEWCEDWYAPYTGGDKTDPCRNTKQSNESSRVLRGGSWRSNPGRCRAACRSWNAPATRGNIFGFRVCFRLD